jgi:hypothetical protein
MPTVTKGWPPERRKAQAERAKKQQPWLKSTGPKTDDGKDVVKNNALQHGFRSTEYAEILRLLRAQASFVKSFKS